MHHEDRESIHTFTSRSIDLMRKVYFIIIIIFCFKQFIYLFISILILISISISKIIDKKNE